MYLAGGQQSGISDVRYVRTWRQHGHFTVADPLLRPKIFSISCNFVLENLKSYSVLAPPLEGRHPFI